MKSNPRLDWMDKPVVLHINGGEAATLLGLVTGAWAVARKEADSDPRFVPNRDMLAALRQKIIDASPE